MNIPRPLAVLLAIAAIAIVFVSALPQGPDVGVLQPSRIRSYYLELSPPGPSTWSTPQELAPAQNRDFMITDIVIGAASQNLAGAGGGGFNHALVEILEDSVVKTTLVSGIDGHLGSTSASHSASVGASNTNLVSGIPIRMGAPIKIRVWSGGWSTITYPVRVTICGYLF